MKKSLIVSFTVCVMVFAPSVASAAGWKCAAKNLRNYSYNGGNTAYIHLRGYSSGGTYSVTKSGNTAKGKTKDGTPFTCKKS